MLKDINNTITDKPEISCAVKNNNTAVLEKIYTDNYYRIEQYVLKNNGHVEDAKDVYQQAFTILWRNVQQGKFVPQNEASVAAYLYKVATYKWLDHLRSGYYKKTVNVELDSGAVEDFFYDEEQEIRLTLIKKNFAILGDNCKKLLSQFYYKDQSLRKIAETMGWTEATARNNKYRCIEKLKSLIHHEK